MIGWAISHWPWLLLGLCLAYVGAFALCAASADADAAVDAALARDAQPPSMGDEAAAVVFDFPVRDLAPVVELASHRRDDVFSSGMDARSGGAVRAVATIGRGPANSCGRPTRSNDEGVS